MTPRIHYNPVTMRVSYLTEQTLLVCLSRMNVAYFLAQHSEYYFESCVSILLPAFIQSFIHYKLNLKEEFFCWSAPVFHPPAFHYRGFTSNFLCCVVEIFVIKGSVFPLWSIITLSVFFLWSKVRFCVRFLDDVL